MPSKLEPIVTIAASLFVLMANGGLGGNSVAPETPAQIAESPGQELIKAGSKECPPGVDPKNHD